MPCLEFTGKESLRNGIDTDTPILMPFTISMVVQIGSYTNTMARLSGRSQTNADVFASVRPFLNAGMRTIASYASATDFVYNQRSVGDPRTEAWIVVIASFQPKAVGPCAVLFDDKYAEALMTIDTGSATNVLGTNYNANIATEDNPEYNTGLIGKYAEFRIDPYAMAETEMRKFRDDQMFRYGLT